MEHGSIQLDAVGVLDCNRLLSALFRVGCVSIVCACEGARPPRALLEGGCENPRRSRVPCY